MNSLLYKSVARPLMFRLNPESAHELAMFGLRVLPAPLLRLLGSGSANGSPVELFGLKFPNPIGLAAGFDKNAVALPAWEALGFGFIEAGTITAHGQPGNPKPRIFRFPDLEALVNRMGFNNDGSEAVAARLEALKRSGRWPGIPVGINIGKTKLTPLEQATEDYVHSFGKLFPYADYFALNVSSPNTPGLRTLQNKESLGELFAAIQRRNAELSGTGRRKPVLVKIAPDLEFGQIEDVLGLIGEHGIDGIIATNTTLDHSCVEAARRREGGLSGRPLRNRSTDIVRFIAGRSRVPIIGVGGIYDADSALEKFDAGASLVQLYTGFVYEGPSLIAAIQKRLASNR